MVGCGSCIKGGGEVAALPLLVFPGVIEGHRVTSRIELVSPCWVGFTKNIVIEILGLSEG